MGSAGAGVERHVVGDAVVVGVAASTPAVVADDFDVLLTAQPRPPRPWVTGSLDDLGRAVERAPVAATALVHVLRAVELLEVPAALTVESMAYSMLQRGEGFQRWLGARPRRQRAPLDADVVRLARRDGRLEIVLHRPELHNAFNAAMRDALVEAFELVAVDPSITEVDLRGAGASFCSGGDLDEFGLAGDAGAAHVLRIAQSVGRRVDACRDRVSAHIHGACIGAGIEIAAFAGRVIADPDTQIRLPELAMGLIPGAGGTVSLSRRIGRQRTAWLALTGQVLDAETARRWGLVDAVSTATAHRSA